MKASRKQTMARVARAVADCAPERPTRVSGPDRLVGKLGYDSLRMATLALALEDEFGQPLMLAEWVGTVRDPDDLTVSSLCDFVERRVVNSD